MALLARHFRSVTSRTTYACWSVTASSSQYTTVNGGWQKTPLNLRHTICLETDRSNTCRSRTLLSVTMATLQTLNFDNLVLRSLPLDTTEENRPRQVQGACFSLVEPTPVKNPETVAISESALSLLDLPVTEAEKQEFAHYFSGSKLLPGSKTAAHCYCGHQFGNFAGQLGDGAAIYLGEIVNSRGERWELQLKGAGLTPYSRSADGRKVLRSSIREFLCSEAMYHLGIPTTRAGCCVTSDSKVIRDIFYDGHPIQEKCTIVSRIAPTFIRFGSFQICKPPDRSTGRDGPSVGRTDILQTMLEHVVKTFYPEIWSQHCDNRKQMCEEFFREVVARTARLVAMWQCVGWCHGVLNTDNMSIVGVTIDYGPYGFLDSYDPAFICNDSDNEGRYSYANQPAMCKWNCERLMDALSQLPDMDMSGLFPILQTYQQTFDDHYLDIMRKKFGLLQPHPNDKELVDSFLDAMEKTGADFTNSFRGLSRLGLPGSEDEESRKQSLVDHLLAQCSTMAEAIKAHRPRMDSRQLQMFTMLLQMNPDLMSAMGGGQKLIRDEIKRLEKLKQLKELTEEQKSEADRAVWSAWLERYTERLREEDLSDLPAAYSRRRQLMDSVNPRFILRNYITQNAIELAERGDYTEVRKVLRVIQHPYSDDVDLSEFTAPADKSADAQPTSSCRTSSSYDAKPPDWSTEIRVS